MVALAKKLEFFFFKNLFVFVIFFSVSKIPRRATPGTSSCFYHNFTVFLVFLIISFFKANNSKVENKNKEKNNYRGRELD